MEESSRENYLVSIYRRNVEDPERIAGLVEFIEGGDKRNFATFNELRAILNPDQVKSEGKQQKKDGKRND